jgi:drug/metabolite transporter (DMT)-like permease
MRRAGISGVPFSIGCKARYCEVIDLYYIAIGLCMLAGIFWAGSGVAAQHFFLHSSLGPMDLTAFRMLCTGLIMTGVTMITGAWKKNWQRVKQEPRLWGKMAVYGIVGLMAMHYSYFKAIALGNAAVVTVIQYSCPAMIIAYEAVRHRTWPDAGGILAVLMSIAGTFLLATGGHVDRLMISTACLMWSLVAAVTFAFCAVYPKSILQKLDNSFLLAWGMYFGALASYGITQHVEIHAFLLPEVLFDMFCIVIGGTVIAFICYNLGLKYLNPAQAALTATVEPVASVFLSWIVFGKVFGLVESIGIILIVTAIAMPAASAWHKKKKHAEEKA